MSWFYFAVPAVLYLYDRGMREWQGEENHLHYKWGPDEAKVSFVNVRTGKQVWNTSGRP